MNLNKIYKGNSLDVLKKMPDKSVNCCITSPPYWALRNYGCKGQLGLEKTPDEYITKMIDVFREVKRVLVEDGTLWLNIGDTYYGGKGNNGASIAYSSKNKALNQSAIIGTIPGTARPNDLPIIGLKPKDLIGIPWMLAFALRADGWYLRQDIIWSKPNPMPESCNDRCTKSHEYIFLLSKSKHYYFDALSIATPYKDKTLTTFGIETKGYGDGSRLIASENWAKDVKVRKPKEWMSTGMFKNATKFNGKNAGKRRQAEFKIFSELDTSRNDHGSYHKERQKKGRNPRIGIDTKGGNQGIGDIPMAIHERGLKGHSGNYDADNKIIGTGKANKRSVWTVPTEPFKEAHYATFPQRLIADCIRAGCPEDGIILDPFMGAGTTALVARKLNRNYVGIELNPEYIQLAKKRLQNELGIFL